MWNYEYTVPENKKVRVSGKIISSQNNILIIKPIQLSDIKK